MQIKIYLLIVFLSLLINEGILGQFVKKSTCPPGVNQVNCFVDPCLNKVCPADPKAVCTSNYCGQCNAVWQRPNGMRARCNKRNKRSQSGCPTGQKKVLCFRDPCQGEKCPADASAKCISNYCGSCTFSWKNSNGKPAQCNTNS